MTIKTQVLNETELNILEKDKMIEGLNTQMKEMQRKIELGSQQVQGEVQELAIEEFLRVSFPLDLVQEIGKGKKGADCVQIINTPNRLNCGSILYESKRTKEFSNGFISKLKDDLRAKNATFAVIVTSTMPRDMERLGQKDGIWICTFQEFKGLCQVLREAVVQLCMAVSTQENKGDKMVMLYDFLTSNEFRMQIEAIVEGFSQMDSDLTSERRSMEMIWKKREKQIQKVLQNTILMYGSIKGIAGTAIGTIKALELPAPEAVS